MYVGLSLIRGAEMHVGWKPMFQTRMRAVHANVVRSMH
jgi:hypothetical protein